MDARFYFATCQAGVEKPLKQEILAEFPHLKFAYSRPGFVTFKEDLANAGSTQLPLKPPLTRTKSIFARLWGSVLAQVRDPSELHAVLKDVQEVTGIQCVQIFERDGVEQGANGLITLLGPKIERLTPKPGDSVIDIISVESSLENFYAFVGTHELSADVLPTPGNIPLLSLSEESPSTAFLKIEEALLRFKPEGKTVLEVGCSPGGATTALLNRGMTVKGIDPKFMDERLHLNPNFSFVQKLAKTVTPHDLATFNPDWIVMDMNIAPLEALDELSHVISVLRKTNGKAMKLKNGLLTLKLNDWKFTDSIPLYLKRIDELGFKKTTAKQLYHNKQEFFVFAENFN